MIENCCIRIRPWSLVNNVDGNFFARNDLFSFAYIFQDGIPFLPNKTNARFTRVFIIKIFGNTYIKLFICLNQLYKAINSESTYIQKTFFITLQKVFVFMSPENIINKMNFKIINNIWILVGIITFGGIIII